MGDRIAQRLWDVGYSQIANDYLIRMGLEANDTPDEANRPLHVNQHRYAVCSEGDSRRAARRNQNSIELPHNEVHSLLGYPMVQPAPQPLRAPCTPGKTQRTRTSEKGLGSPPPTFVAPTMHQTTPPWFDASEYSAAQSTPATVTTANAASALL